jgi:type 1 glutamine amidotransferase
MKILATFAALAVGGLTSAIAFAEDITAQVSAEVRTKVAEAMPDAAPAKPKKDRKVLIFTKTNGFRHSSIPVGVLSLTMLGEKTGAYSATHSEDEAMFEPESLKQFDAVIMLNTTGDVFRPHPMPQDPAEQKKALEREQRLQKSLADFVRTGKGLAGTHSATDTYHNWKEYNQMMGGVFAGHPWHEVVPIRNLDPDHVINKPFAREGFKINDEIYQFRGDTALPSDRHMLLSLDPEQMDLSKGNRQDGFYPVSWLATHGEGRTFYCSLGHRDEIYYNPKVLKHYLAGFQYALGDLEADASPSK